MAFVAGFFVAALAAGFSVALAAGFFAGALPPPEPPSEFLSAAIRSTTLLPRGSPVPPSSLSMLSVLPFFLRSISSFSAST